MARRYQPKHAKKPTAEAPARRSATEPKPTRRDVTRSSGTQVARSPSPGATKAAASQDPGRAPVTSASDPVVIRTRRGRRSRALVRAPSPYPAREETAARPAWWMRLRGLVGAGMLVTVGGVLVALAVGIVLVLLVIAAVATLA